VGEGQPVTAAGIIPWSLDLTRDGQKLVFIALRTGTQKKELWEKSLADGRERLLAVKEYPFFSPRWSRDGTRLAYQLPTWILSDPRVDPATVILPVDGGDEQKLTSGKGGDGLPFDWSADGRWVVAGSDGGKPGQSALVLLPVSAAPHAEAEARVVVSDSERMLFEGRFSPDDRWLCFNAVGRGGSTLYVVPASGGQWVRITEENGWADKPRWSPDGRAIYFVSRRGSGFLNVWRVKFDPLKGEPLGEPFQVTSYQSPAKGIWTDIGPMGMSLSADRLVLPIAEVTGSIWVLDGVDR
jgi:Tol biopolymer transport system component